MTWHQEDIQPLPGLPLGSFVSALLAILPLAGVDKGREENKSLTLRKHCSVAAKALICYKHHFSFKSKIQYYMAAMKKANTIPAITSTVRQLALHAQFLLNSKQSRKYTKAISFTTKHLSRLLRSGIIQNYCRENSITSLHLPFSFCTVYRHNYLPERHSIFFHKHHNFPEQRLN